MFRISITAGAIASVMAGCASAPQLKPDAAAVAKQIIRDGAELVLPDGTRVTPDATGGFRLPNGAFVRRDRGGALILPTGAQCLPSLNGYTCP